MAQDIEKDTEGQLFTLACNVTKDLKNTAKMFVLEITAEFDKRKESLFAGHGTTKGENWLEQVVLNEQI